jgi:hypothetical protein
MRDIEEYRYMNGSRTIYSFVNSDWKVAISRITCRDVDGNITTGHMLMLTSQRGSVSVSGHIITGTLQIIKGWLKPPVEQKY